MNNILKTVIEKEEEDENIFPTIHADEKSAKETVNFIKAYIKDRKNNSKHKYVALKLLSDALKWKKNPFLISYTSTKLLKRLGKLAEFNSKSTDPERGKLIFGFHTDMNYSNKFYFLLLQTISEWATFFIEEPKYINLYKNLEKKGISFNMSLEQNAPFEPSDLRISHPTFINETKAINEAQYSAADASEFSSVTKFNLTARKDDNEIFYDFTEKAEKDKPIAKSEKRNDFLDFFSEYDVKKEKNTEFDGEGREESKDDGIENAKLNAKLEIPFFEDKPKAPAPEFWSSITKNDPTHESGDFWASIQPKEEPKDIWSNLKTKEKEKKTEDFFNSFTNSQNKEIIQVKGDENLVENKKNMNFFEYSPILEEKKEKIAFSEKDQNNLKFWTSVQTVEREEDKNSEIDLNQFEDFEDVPASEENPENSVEFLHSSLPLPPQPLIHINPPPSTLESEGNKLQFWENLGVINGLNTKIEKSDTPKNILDNSKNFEEFYKERKGSAEKDGSKINLENSKNFDDFKERSQQVLEDNSFFNKGKDSQVFVKSVVDIMENIENNENPQNNIIKNNFNEELEAKSENNEKRDVGFFPQQSDFFGLESNSFDKKFIYNEKNFTKLLPEEKSIPTDNNFGFEKQANDNFNNFFSQERIKDHVELEIQEKEKDGKSGEVIEPDSHPFVIYQQEKIENEQIKFSLEEEAQSNLWLKIPNSLHDGFVQNQELAIIPETEEDLMFSNFNKKNDLKEKEKNNKNLKENQNLKTANENIENSQKFVDLNYFEQKVEKNSNGIVVNYKEEQDKNFKNASQEIENYQQNMDFKYFKQNIDDNDHNLIEEKDNIKNDFNQTIENKRKVELNNEDIEFFDFEEILEKDKIKFENFPMDKIENAERMIGEIKNKFENKNQTFDKKINDLDKNVETIERKLEKIEISQKSFQKIEDNYKNIEKSLKTLEISSQEKNASAASTISQDMNNLRKELENLSSLRKEFSNLENRSVNYSNTLNSIQMNINTLKDNNKNIVSRIDELSNDSKNMNMKNNEFVNKINDLSENMVNKNDLENFKKETNEKLLECSRSLKEKDQRLKDLASEQSEIKLLCEEINSNKEDLLNQVRLLGTKQNGLQNDLLFFKELTSQMEKSYKKTEVFLEEINRRQDEISKNIQNKNNKDENYPKIEDRLSKSDFASFEQHLLESNTQINVLREVCEGLKLEINKINELKNVENLRKKDKELKKLEISKNNENFKIAEKEFQLKEEIDFKKKILAENKLKADGKCEQLGQDIEQLKGYRRNSDKFIKLVDPYKQEEEPQKLTNNAEKAKNNDFSIKKNEKEVSFEKNGSLFNREDKEEELKATLKKDPKNSRFNQLDFVSPLRTNPLKDIERFCNESERLTIPEMSRRTAQLKSKNPSSPDPYSLLKLYNLSAPPVQLSATKSNNPGFYISKPKFRGKILYVSRVKMTKILHSMNKTTSFLKRDFKNLKKCTLINRGLLFENVDIGVFLKTHWMKEGGMKFNIVFQANEGKDLEDFDFRFNENESNLKLRILETSSTPNNGVCCDLEIFCSPLDCLIPFFLNLSYSIKSHFSNFLIPLPLFLIKNCEFPFFARENFIIFWKKNIFNLKSSEPLILNKEIVRNNSDFKLIMSNNMIISKEKNKNRIKIGGLANLFGNIRFAVRFVIFSENVAIIQTVFEGNRTQLFSKIEEEFISELGFLISE